MIHPDEVKRQIAKIGAHNMMWGKAELRELPKILFEDEQLSHVINGRYEGGFAVLCATNYRVILIDKKPFYLTLEDTRYDMISDVQFNHRLINASIWIGTVHKRLSFISYNHARLRDMTSFIQGQVMASRQQPEPQRQPEYASVLGQGGVPLETMGSLPAHSMLSTKKRALVNPYKTPLMIRHRISRFS